jgi:GNAT superfamily N-acetyltransferase
VGILSRLIHPRGRFAVTSQAKIRLLQNSESDVHQVDRLLMTAYRPPSWRQELEVYLTAEPDGWFVADDGGVIVAMAGALLYGSFCWLGLVATLPGHERRGLATRLSATVSEWAMGLGCRTVALDASEKGRPVYERLGFRPVGETLALIAPASPPAGVDDGPKADSLAGVDELLPLDREVFGGDRARLLRAIWELESPRGYMIRDENGPAGYLFARDRLLGPGCARSPEVAERLLRAALSDPSNASDQEIRLLVPTESAFTSTLLALGFRESRRLTHMRLGDLDLPGERRQLLAQASFAAG